MTVMIHPAIRAKTIPLSYGRSKRPWYRIPLLVSAAVIASAAGITSSSIQFHSFCGAEAGPADRNQVAGDHESDEGHDECAVDDSPALPDVFPILNPQRDSAEDDREQQQVEPIPYLTVCLKTGPLPWPGVASDERDQSGHDEDVRGVSAHGLVVRELVQPAGRFRGLGGVLA